MNILPSEQAGNGHRIYSDKLLVAHNSVVIPGVKKVSGVSMEVSSRRVIRFASSFFSGKKLTIELGERWNDQANVFYIKITQNILLNKYSIYL